MLVLTRKTGESIRFTIGDTEFTATIVEFEGKRVRIGIDAPPAVRIVRTELLPQETTNEMD